MVASHSPSIYPCIHTDYVEVFVPGLNQGDSNQWLKRPGDQPSPPAEKGESWEDKEDGKSNSGIPGIDSFLTVRSADD